MFLADDKNKFSKIHLFKKYYRYTDYDLIMLQITSLVWLISFCEARPQEHPAAVAAQSHVDGATPVPIVSFTESVGENGAFNYRWKHEPFYILPILLQC